MEVQRRAGLKIDNPPSQKKFSNYSSRANPNTQQEKRTGPIGNGVLATNKNENFEQIRAFEKPSASVVERHYGPPHTIYETPYSQHSLRSRNGTHHSMQIVHGQLLDGACCVCCIAMVTKIPYEKVKEAAIRYGGFAGKGMSFFNTSRTLSFLGIPNRLHSGIPDLSKIPDRSILTVCVEGYYHAVVFRRLENGKSYIYDRNLNRPVDPARYRFKREWIEVGPITLEEK